MNILKIKAVRIGEHVILNHRNSKILFQHHFLQLYYKQCRSITKVKEKYKPKFVKFMATRQYLGFMRGNLRSYIGDARSPLGEFLLYFLLHFVVTSHGVYFLKNGSRNHG